MTTQQQLKKLDELMFDLYTFLSGIPGDRTAHSLRRNAENVLAILREDNQLPPEGCLEKAKQALHLLYPPRDGLDEYVFWDDDYWKRQKLNEPLDQIRRELQPFLND